MPKAARAFIDLQLIGDERGVLKMLAHLDTCFSPVGMAAFLGGDVTPWLRERAAHRFVQGGDDASGPWAPLRPATVEIRAGGIQRGEWPGISPTHPINKRTGLMEDFITKGAGEIVSSPGSTTLYFPKRQVGVKMGLDKKVKRAQAGDSRTKARPVLAVGEVDLVTVVQSLAYFIQRGPSNA
jgi:hypothetical protein